MGGFTQRFMKQCAFCGRENASETIHCRECGTVFVGPSADSHSQETSAGAVESLRIGFSELLPDRRWFVFLLGLLVLAVASALFLWRDGARTKRPGIVVLATWYTNGEQLVTFRPEPPSAVVTYVELISVSVDPDAPPPTVRSFGEVIPIRNEKETNYSLHLVAHLEPGMGVGGRRLAYTPGSYTVAYTPTENAHRVRVGVAFAHKGIADYFQRLRMCWEQKTLALIKRKSHREPTFITTEPISNAVPKPDSPH
ncbi:MAG: hypothetical protein ACYDC1_00190 [Limisphaerales bacterium]